MTKRDDNKYKSFHHDHNSKHPPPLNQVKRCSVTMEEQQTPPPSQPSEQDKPKPTTIEDDNFEFEQQLLTVKEIFVYKLPPLRTASGYR